MSELATISLQAMNICGDCNFDRDAWCICSRGTPRSSGDGRFVTGANWQASVGSNNSGGALASASWAPTSHRPDRMSPRKTPPKRTCRDVTAAMLHGRHLDYCGMKILDFPVPDSQESIFSFAAASASLDVSSADAYDETNVAVPCSQDSYLADQAERTMLLNPSTQVDAPSDGGNASAVSGSAVIADDRSGGLVTDVRNDAGSRSRLDVVREELAEQHGRTIVALVRSGSLACPVCP